jgi:hypothetical protein
MQDHLTVSAAAICVLERPMPANSPNIMACGMGHNTRDCAGELTGCCGPAQVHRQGTADSHYRPMRASRLAAILLAANH